MEAIMLKLLFPKIHRRYAKSPVGGWLQGFAEWLLKKGYTRACAHRHVRRLKQVLERVDTVAPDSKFTPDELAQMFTVLQGQQCLIRGTERAFQQFLGTRNCLLIKDHSGRFLLCLPSTAAFN